MEKQPLKIIIAGASGRMGSLLVDLVLKSKEYELAGVLETRERLNKLGQLPCIAADNIKNLLSVIRGAVVIDFTAPDACMHNAQMCAENDTCMVIGTTGLKNEDLKHLDGYARKVSMLWSANMSVGITALLAIMPLLSQTLGHDYDMEIMEIHHKRKKDAPSGTALMLADGLAKSRGWTLDKTRISARDGITGERAKEEIGVLSLRGGDVVGIHSTYFMGPGEMIEVKHIAESRENFAMGALRAASWLITRKPGKLYSMQDVLGLQQTN